MAVVLPDETVVGENPGTAIITVASEDGNKTAIVNITVQEIIVLLEKIEVSDVILEAGTSQFINVKTTPAQAKYSKLKVIADNDSVTITPVTRNTSLVTAKKQGYLANVEVVAEDCEQSDVDTNCTTVFNVFTIDNGTAKLPETLLTVETYNIIQEDATYYKIKLPFNNGAKIYPVNAVKKYPANSYVAADEWEVLVPASSDGDQVLVRHEDNSVSAQSLGSAVITVGVLGHNEIKPVIFMWK